MPAPLRLFPIEDPGRSAAVHPGPGNFAADGEAPEAFSALQQRFPESPWTAKARVVLSLQENLRQQRQTVNRLQASQQAVSKRNQELQQQVEALQKDLQTLELERTKLRQLLIDLEQRGR
ncbi:MAG: hypothetical protein R2864_11810 [Syntrophotaleaceae bacterium]